MFQQVVIDACELDDVSWNSPSGLTQRFPPANRDSTAESYDRNLDDPLPARLQTCRLDVDDDEIFEGSSP
jgi:hypothetical protein